MKLQKPQKGFTIIEVLIVLAIAALIILIALIAVPQLQRNQRNQARQAIAGRISTEINNYIGNNNGNLPTMNNNVTTGFTGGFQTRYLTGVNVNDPQSGASVMGGVVFAGTAPGATAGNLLYRTGQVCNGEGLLGGNPRNFAFMIRLEGGAIRCLDNR